MSDPLADCGHCTLSPTVSGKPARDTQATCPVHGTPPYAPLRAPLASSQALPADQAHPAVRAGQDAYMELLRTGDGCPGTYDVAAAVAPAVLLWAGQQFVAAAERHAASGCPERLAVASGKYAAAAMAATWADEIAAASSVPTGTRERCSCCQRAVSPLDDDGRCVHCGPNRARSHTDESPCNLGIPTNGDRSDG